MNSPAAIDRSWGQKRNRLQKIGAKSTKFQEGQGMLLPLHHLDMPHMFRMDPWPSTHVSVGYSMYNWGYSLLTKSAMVKTWDSRFMVI